MDDVRLQEKLAFIAREAVAARNQAALYRSLSASADDTLRAAVLGGVKYAVQTSLQAMIDVAYRVCATAWRIAPKDAYDAFEQLATHGAVDRSRLSIYRRMVGFRNRVVHGYEDVEAERTLEYAERTEDFDGFRAEMRAFASDGGSEAVSDRHTPSRGSDSGTTGAAEAPEG